MNLIHEISQSPMLLEWVQPKKLALLLSESVGSSTQTRLFTCFFNQNIYVNCHRCSVTQRRVIALGRE